MSNPQRRYDLVIADVDGCLISESPGSFDITRLALIAEHNRLATERGDRPMLTFCTGRPQPFTEALCRLLQNMSVPTIAENGVWLYHAGTNDYMMDPAITEVHLSAVHDAEAWMRHEYRGEGFTIQPGKRASVSLYHPCRETMLTKVEAVKEAVATHGWSLRVSTTWFYINCDLTHINKGTGIRRLLEYTQTPRERLAGIGDTAGDSFIADAVSFFACPSNADDNIRKRAHYISPHPEAAGVVDILDRLAR